jgi:hypothetical protein
LVRKVRGGSDSADHRFVILSEMEMANGRADFLFKPLGPEMTLREVSEALIRRGISERDAFKLISDATHDFEHP